jgi:hypothetical protein
MKVCQMFRNTVMGMIIHSSVICCGLIVVGSAIVPSVASARNVTTSKVQAIKKRLVNVVTKEELVPTLEAARSAGAPWTMLFESVVLYTIKTGDYSMLNVITPYIKEYANDFNAGESLLFDSEAQAAVFLRVFVASVDLHDGDEESALENLRKAKDIDPIELKELLPYAVTIQKYINA